jgi:hypothetical protein
MKEILLKHITNILSKVPRVVLAITIALVLTKNSFAKEKSYYELQAELVYNFTEYVTWFSHEAKSPKSLCIIGDNPVIPYLKELLENKNEENIIIVRKHENDYLEDCNILFINDNYDGYLRRILLRVKNKPILTFGNMKDFAENGGIVQFTLRNNRVEFKINIKEMRSSRLRISDSILSVSDTIN